VRRPWLGPLTPLYAAGVALRNLRLEKSWEPVRRLSWPVVSIGNLSTGGAGKTPLTIALAGLLRDKGFQVDVLSRGYGRRSTLPVRVQPDGAAEEFGDEPLLMARAGIPVYVARERYQAGLLAEIDRPAAAPPGVHLLDDGFQHRQLARDVDILLLNRADWRDTLLPAGNLRESVQAAKRASVMAIPVEEADLEAALRRWGWQGPIWRIARRMEVPAVSGAAMAFCGIARSGQFFGGLEAAGLRLAARKAFRDHHRYTARTMERLAAAARAAGAETLVTTEKDAVRLGGLAAMAPKGLPVVTARLHTEIEDADGVVEWLRMRLESRADVVR
jgi:tetraacyldisaccharide 4'-kinase